MGTRIPGIAPSPLDLPMDIERIPISTDVLIYLKPGEKFTNVNAIDTNDK